MTEQSESNGTVKPQITDAELVEDTKSTTSWGERLLSADHWLRFAFMALFAIILWLVAYIMIALVIFQFVWDLVTGEENSKLRQFGSRLSQYIYQVLRFLTYNTEDKPFPFADWPVSEENN